MDEALSLSEDVDLTPAPELDVEKLRSVLVRPTRASRHHTRNAKADRNGRTLRRDLGRQGVRLS